MCIRKKRSNFIALKVNGYAYFLLAEYYHLILLFMDKSIFSVKAEKPTLEGLKQGIGKTFAAWQALVDFVIEQYPAAQQEWHFAGEKYGWSFRVKDKKRVIVYLLPRDGYFKTAFVFGQKAYDTIMDSKIAEDIKEELRQAKPYAEGRGIRTDIKAGKLPADIKKLVEIKLAN